ncbi:MAG TPA: hypothetical protein VMB05_10130 [Solirubrobacteraceae bacterium]|nr:hypothetical protein [Solirubrobacteraceae bacterium]
MIRRRSMIVPIATLVLLSGFASQAAASHAAASPRAVAAGCSIPHHGEHLGPTYLTSLSVSGTSCDTGLTVVAGYHACQVKHGGVKGTCNSSIDGFRCSEKRGPSIPTEFFSSVSCKNGAKRVSYKYSQFT